jgi:NDP-sugar pyrophosphorylase family protein
MPDPGSMPDTGGMRRAAVILAGGHGPPMVLPRPLLPVGDRAIVDIVLRQLRDAGFEEVVITGGRHAPLLRTVLGDGSSHGLRIRYLVGSRPPGNLAETFLMLRGDALTDLDYGHLLASHRQGGNALTIATAEREVESDFGILRTEGRTVTAYDASPRLRHRVDMGVYAVEPAALEHAGEPFDGGALATALLAAGEQVGSYFHDGCWLDLSRRDDFERAQRAA